MVIGYHQDIRTEADAAACRERGIDLHRRLTGGGSILMGEGQLGLALAMPRSAVSTAGGFGPVFEALSGGIIDALRHHGVESVLRPKNDLAVDGRKICGVGAYTDAAGMLLFHASILVGIDLDLMLEVLRIPDAKLRDKMIASVREGMTTLRAEAGADVSVEEFAAGVEDGYRRSLGVRLDRVELDPVRVEDVERLAATRYRDPGWLHLGSRPGTQFTQVARRTVGGMVVVRCWQEAGRVRELQLRGDFFAERGVVDAIEGALRGATAERRPRARRRGPPPRRHVAGHRRRRRRARRRGDPRRRRRGRPRRDRLLRAPRGRLVFRVLLSWDVAPGMEAEHARPAPRDGGRLEPPPRLPPPRRLAERRSRVAQVVALEEWDDPASWSTWAYASEEGSRDLARLRQVVRDFTTVPLSNSAVLPMPVRALDVREAHPERTHRS